MMMDVDAKGAAVADSVTTYFMVVGEGQMGSTLMGSLQISCFLTEELFGYSC